MSQRFSGQTARRYDEFPERARKLLFSKDRENRKAVARYAKAESTLDFIHWVIRDEGTRDPAWVLERITESLLGHGYWPKCGEHLAPEPCGECLGIPERQNCLPGCNRLDGHDGRDPGACMENGCVLVPGPLDLVHRHPDIPVAVPVRQPARAVTGEARDG